jgi:predicted protein tyrosine phosphatase
MMPWIENVSKSNANAGIHYDTEGRGVLISIIDPCSSEVQPKHKFLEIHRFEFLDTEDETDEFSISDEQAQRIAEILVHCKRENLNVVCHCTAGLCRSGAVTECGIMIGFKDTERNRLPNVLVKGKIMKALGIHYTSDKDLEDRKTIFSVSEWE